MSPRRAFSPQFFLQAELFRIARYLMAESPSDAESFAWDHSNWEEVVGDQYAVIDLRLSEGGSTAYIVFRDGARYTTTSIPADFDGQVQVWQIPAPDGFARRRFQITAASLRKLGPRLFTQPATSELVSAVEDSGRPQPVETEPQLSLQSCMADLKRSAGSADAFIDANQLYNAMVARFRGCRLMGTAYERAAGTLAFFASHPDRNALRRALVNEGRGVQEVMEAGDFFVIPPLDVNFYLCNPNSAGKSSFAAAISAARQTRTAGASLVREAVGATSIWAFHSKLYHGLAAYRAAFFILSQLKFLTEHVPDLWPTLGTDEHTLHRWWVECEEARVNIYASLREAALGRRTSWNIGRPERLINIARTLPATYGTAESFEIVKDMCVRLVIPSFVCDLLMGVVAAETRTDMSRHATRVARAVRTLETDLETAIFRGDPAYLDHAYAVGRWLADQTDNLQLADELREAQEILPERLLALTRTVAKQGEERA